MEWVEAFHEECCRYTRYCHHGRTTCYCACSRRSEKNSICNEQRISNLFYNIQVQYPFVPFTSRLCATLICPRALRESQSCHAFWMYQAILPCSWTLADETSPPNLPEVFLKYLGDIDRVGMIIKLMLAARSRAIRQGKLRERNSTWPSKKDWSVDKKYPKYFLIYTWFITNDWERPILNRQNPKANYPKQNAYNALKKSRRVKPAAHHLQHQHLHHRPLESCVIDV